MDRNTAVNDKKIDGVMKKNMAAVIGLSLAAFILAAAGKMSGRIDGAILAMNVEDTDAVPEPRLLSPIGETVDLTGKDTLEFKWSPFEGVLFKRRFYDFRLYKGRLTYAKDEIYKKRVSPNEYAVVLKADMFDDGQVYTWTLRQVYDEDKSEAAYNAFKVIKSR
jgi:hypothetical protein